MMKLVTSTSNLAKRYGLKKAIEMLKDAGFDGYDCSLSLPMADGGIFSADDYKEKAQEIRDYADTLNFPCLQTHTPSHASDIKGMTYFLAGVEKERRAVEISGILGAEVAVVHPTSVTDAEGNHEMLYSKLLPTAKKYGVKIACENMFAWKEKPDTETVPTACGTSREFVRYVDMAKDENFVACIDIGHSYLPNTEGAESMIAALGKSRLKALHVNDNNMWDDEHVFPFFGKINWEPVCASLAKIDYDGNFTFESDALLAKYPDELVTVCLELLEKIGRYLISRIEYYKSLK